MAISITLNHTIETTSKGTVRLTVEAVGTEIESEVFAIEVLPKSADGATPVYRFSHVCSPAELVEFPSNEPLDNCYFRVSEITMVFDTRVNCDMLLNTLTRDVQRLVNEYKALEVEESGTVIIS